MRLAHIYLQMLEGASDARAFSTGIKLPLGNAGEISLDATTPGLEAAMHNPFLAARTLDERLREIYLDLSHPINTKVITAGQLVKATLLVQPAHLQIQNSELVHPTEDPYYVVAFTSVDQVPGIGRIFLGLVGSEQNLIKLPGDGTIGSRSASDARGLYQIIQNTKEAKDVDISSESLRQEFPKHYEDATDEQRLLLAAEAFHGYSLQAAPRPMELLFEVHHVARNVELEALGLGQFGKGAVELAVIGAPVWIREATDRTLISVEDVLSGPNVVEDLWRTLDRELNAAIRDSRYLSEWMPESAEEWRHFGEWAVAYSNRVGGSVVPMDYYPSRYRFFGRELGGRAGALAESEISGWVTNYWGLGYLLSETGSIYVVAEQDGRALYVGSDYGSPQPVRWSDRDAQKAASAIIDRLVTWLTPFGPRS